VFILLSVEIQHLRLPGTMENFFSSFRSTEGRKDRRQAYEKEKGGVHCITDPLLKRKEWSVSFTFPSDISARSATASSRSSVETSLICYDDYPSYPTYEEPADDPTLEIDGVMAMNKSARSGVSLRRRVSGSYRSLKKGLKRMAKRKHQEKSSRNGTMDQDDESMSTIEWSNCENDVKRRKTGIPALRKKFVEWVKSVRRSALKSCREETPKEVSGPGTAGARPKAARKFIPLECNSVSYDGDVYLF
jgi:hypothetical protein